MRNCFTVVCVTGFSMLGAAANPPSRRTDKLVPTVRRKPMPAPEKLRRWVSVLSAGLP